MRKLTLTLITIVLLLSSVSGGPFRTESDSSTQGLLAPAPADVLDGASIAAAMGLAGAPIDSVFALRGGGTTDFWHYSISQDEWTALPHAPAPVGEGGAIVEVSSFTFCQPGRFYVAALRGGNATDFWHFNIDENRWCAGPGTPSPVGTGGAIAQLQGSGKIYALRGNGTGDFWSFEDGRWKTLANTPGPVGAGSGLVGINYGTRSNRSVLYALQGGGSTALWKYDVATDSWTHQSDVPGPVGPGGAITSANVGDAGEGTLNILQGGESTMIWSLDIAADSWKLIDNAPSAIAAGGTTSNQFNGCDFSFVGGGSRQFFSTGLLPCVADAPSFSLSFDQPIITIRRGTKVKVRLNVLRTGSFTGNVKILAPTMVPSGIKVPEPLATLTDESIGFKIKVKGKAAVGAHDLTFIGMDEDGRRRSVNLTLIVQ